MSYLNLLKVRDTEVDGVSDWTWVAEDHGAWDGPHSEWMSSHRDAYLKYTKGRKVVVQAGGNCGLYPRLFSKYFDLVYTFEPDPLNFHCLVNNCQQDNIIKINAAVGNINTLVEVKRGGMGNVGTHRVEPTESERAFVPQFKIDQLALKACDLIQLDIEGYEYTALQGALETIGKFHPVISCECGNDAIRSLIEPFGYTSRMQVGADTVYACD